MIRSFKNEFKKYYYLILSLSSRVYLFNFEMYLLSPDISHISRYTGFEYHRGRFQGTSYGAFDATV